MKPAWWKFGKLCARKNREKAHVIVNGVFPLILVENRLRKKHGSTDVL